MERTTGGLQAKALTANVRVLADIYNWFTEGLDTVDLKDAKALLDESNTIDAER